MPAAPGTIKLFISYTRQNLGGMEGPILMPARSPHAID